MAVLSLDVGDRRIGVAVSDPSETFALPLRVIERDSLRADLASIVEIAADYAADTIVVGDPITLSGRRGTASERINKFCAALARAFAGNVEKFDERLTTAQATRALIDADVSRAKRKRVVDRMAAALILDGYLARRRAPRA